MVKFLTSNQNKVNRYKAMLQEFDADFEPFKVELIEIQTDNARELAQAKAKKAANLVEGAFFINDAGWEIPALNGFPGAYMKYINHWFASEDFLRLMNGIEDRRIILKDYFACGNDNGEIKIFEASFPAEIIDKPVGEGSSIDRIVYFSKVNKTISEFTDEDRKIVYGGNPIWFDLAQWIKEQ